MRYCKMVIVGDSRVGKTQFVNMFFKRTFLSEREFGEKLNSKTLIVNGKVVKLQMLDLPGNQIFWSTYDFYFQDADGCIFLYDITNDYLDQFCYLDVCIEEIEKIAAKYNLKFFETSAKTGHNVDLVFTTFVEDILSEQTIHRELDERKQVNISFFSKFKKVFSRTKPTNSVESANSSNSRSSEENDSPNRREIFTKQLLGDDRESSHQFAGTESVVKELEPPISQVLMPGPQVNTLDWSSCSQGTLHSKYVVFGNDEQEPSNGRNSQHKASTSNQEKDNDLRENCAFIEPEYRYLIEPVSRDIIEPESRGIIEPESRYLIEPESRDIIDQESRDIIEPESRDVIELEFSLFSQTSLSRNDRTTAEDVDNTDYKRLLNIQNIITDES